VDVISIGYANTLEAKVLEDVFPKAHWVMENPDSDRNPPEFDFVGNAGQAGKAIREYVERVKTYAGDSNHAPPIPCWERDFLKTYGVGERLQKLGLHPKISIA